MDTSASNDEATGPSPDRLMDVEHLRTEFKRLRRAQGLSQVRVAEELGITQASLSAWETAKSQSLRMHTLNKVIHLVNTWRADSNIVQIPADRMKGASRGRDKPDRNGSSPAKDRAREKMIKAVRSKLGFDSASADGVADLSWRDLLDVYILSKLG